MAGYMTSTVVSAKLDALVTAYPGLCTRSGPGDWQAGTAGGKSGYVKIGATAKDSPAQRWAVLLIGGVHARELAPPDALVSFLQRLLAAYKASTAVTYPSWTDPVNNITYGSFIIPWPWVKNIVESLDLYVAPLVNDDGRDFVLAPLPSGTPHATQELHKNWRKNRRAAPSGNSDPHAVGIDINRNFDIVWNFPKFYDMSIPDVDVHTSTSPVDETYAGDVAAGSAESEPEVKNVANLMRTKSISYFVDFHMYGRDVLYSWGTESNQSTDAAQTFSNSAFDGKRDGINHSAYAEYIPDLTVKAAAAIAQAVSGDILAKAGADPKARARSGYTAKQSSYLYVTSGSSDDYCFSRWFAPFTGGAPVSPVFAYTIEIGGDPSLGPDNDDGGWSPDYVKQYPKLEREIHIAAWKFLSIVAATAFQAPSAPPTPAPPKPASSGSSGCLPLLLACLLIVASVAAAVTGAVVLGGILGGGAVGGGVAAARKVIRRGDVMDGEGT
jgi:Zinc carboxypeptidase